MNSVKASVVSVHTGFEDDAHKQAHDSIMAELDGIVGDHHKSYTREAWANGDKQAEGTIRRNERQWSAVSVEELADVGLAMDLTEPISADSVGANLCLKGVADLSRLRKGTLMQFPSGAELMVEEYNPPCHYMGKKLAECHTTKSGEPLSSTAFSKAAKLKRGLVGVIEAAGVINAGDEVTVVLYEHPSWLA